MSTYTLNDNKFDPTPLTLFVSDPNYEPDENAIQKGFQDNRELMVRMKKKLEEKETALQISTI